MEAQRVIGRLVEQNAELQRKIDVLHARQQQQRREAAGADAGRGGAEAAVGVTDRQLADETRETHNTFCRHCEKAFSLQEHEAFSLLEHDRMLREHSVLAGHSFIYVACVRILCVRTLHVCKYICVLILLCMCPGTTAASALELSTHVQALVEDKEGLVAERAMLLRSAGIYS